MFSAGTGHRDVMLLSRIVPRKTNHSADDAAYSLDCSTNAQGMTMHIESNMEALEVLRHLLFSEENPHELDCAEPCNVATESQAEANHGMSPAAHRLSSASFSGDNQLASMTQPTAAGQDEVQVGSQAPVLDPSSEPEFFSLDLAAFSKASQPKNAKASQSSRHGVMQPVDTMQSPLSSTKVPLSATASTSECKGISGRKPLISRKVEVKSFAIMGNSRLVESYLSDSELVDNDALLQMHKEERSSVFIAVGQHDASIIFIIRLHQNDSKTLQCSLLHQVFKATPQFLVFMEKYELPFKWLPRYMTDGRKSTSVILHRFDKMQRGQHLKQAIDIEDLGTFTGNQSLHVLKDMLKMFPCFYEMYTRPAPLQLHLAVRGTGENFCLTAPDDHLENLSVLHRVEKMFEPPLVSKAGSKTQSHEYAQLPCPSRVDLFDLSSDPFWTCRIFAEEWLVNLLGSFTWPVMSVMATRSHTGSRDTDSLTQSAACHATYRPAAMHPEDLWVCPTVADAEIDLSDSATSLNSSQESILQSSMPGRGKATQGLGRTRTLSTGSWRQQNSRKAPLTRQDSIKRPPAKTPGKSPASQPPGRRAHSSHDIHKIMDLHIWKLQQSEEDISDQESRIVPFPAANPAALRKSCRKGKAQEIFWWLNGINPCRPLLHACRCPIQVITLVGEDEAFSYRLARQVLGSTVAVNHVDVSQGGQACRLVMGIKAMPTCVYIIQFLHLGLMRTFERCESAYDALLVTAVGLSNLFVLISKRLSQSSRLLASILDRASSVGVNKLDSSTETGLFSSNFLLISRESQGKTPGSEEESRLLEDSEAASERCGDKIISDVLSTFTNGGRVCLLRPTVEGKDPGEEKLLQRISYDVGYFLKNTRIASFANGCRFLEAQQIALTAAAVKVSQGDFGWIRLVEAYDFHMAEMQEITLDTLGSPLDWPEDAAVSRLSHPTSGLTAEEIAPGCTHCAPGEVKCQQYNAKQREFVQQVIQKILVSQTCSRRCQMEHGKYCAVIHAEIGRIIQQRCAAAKERLRAYLEECGCPERLGRMCRHFLHPFQSSWNLCRGVCDCGYCCLLPDRHDSACDCLRKEEGTGGVCEPGCGHCTVCDWRHVNM